MITKIREYGVSLIMLLYFSLFFINVLRIPAEIVQNLRYDVYLISTIYGILTLYEAIKDKKKDKIYVLFFLATVLLSTLLLSANYRTVVIFDFLCLFMFMVTFYLNQNEKSIKILRLLMGMEIIYSFIFTFGTMVLIAIYPENVNLDANRVIGLYNGPNNAGGFCWMSMVFSCYYLNLNSYDNKYIKNFIKYVLLFNIFIQSLMIMLCDSRTAQINILLIIGYYIFKNLRISNLKMTNLKRIIISILICLFYVFSLNQIKDGISKYINQNFDRDYNVEDLASEIINSDTTNENQINDNLNVEYSPEYEYLKDSSPIVISLNRLSSNRVVLWMSSIQIALERPILGFGLSSFNYCYNVFLSYSNSHNLFVNIFIQCGLLGLAVFLLLMFEWIKNDLSYLFKSLNEDYFVIFVICSLVTSMLDIAVLFSTNMITFFFWTLQGYLIYNNPKVIK